MRRGKGGLVIKDAGAIYVTLPHVPKEMANLVVNVRGVLIPRIRFGECPGEKRRGKKARKFVVKVVTKARKVRFCDPVWDGKSNRIVAKVDIDGFNLAEEIVKKGLGRVATGKRKSWCTK